MDPNTSAPDLPEKIAQFAAEISPEQVNSGANDPQLQVEIELAAARSLVRNGRLAEAYELLARAAERRPESAVAQMLAETLLLVAKAWQKRGGDDASTWAEEALRLAVSMVPSVAAATLAQFLQKKGNLQDAVAAWQEAIRRNPQDSGGYLSLARLYQRLGNPEKAAETALDLVNAAPSARNTLVVAQLLDELASSLPAPGPGRTVKIALLGNATLDHLKCYLAIECRKAGLAAEIYLGGFDQYTQEILDERSGLYAFAPDVVVLAVHPSKLFPQLHHYPFDLKVEERRAEIENGLARVENLLATLGWRSSALVLLHNMVIPQYPVLGTLDLREDLGQIAAFTEINLRLTEMVRDRFKNVYIVDEERVQARSGKATATDPRMWFSARLPWSDPVLAGLAREYLRFIRPLKGLTRKAIVLDLDNTLWGGVIGEDGLSGIKLGSEAPGNAFVAFQRELERLWKRGILLAVSSKNNPDDALPVFEQHPDMVLKLSHFAAHRINWQSKADNIREIARELNIGLDSLVFLDDNPVERARVRAELPQVLVPELPTDPALYRTVLAQLDVFDNLAMTEEDRNRNKLYAEQKARHEYEANFESNSSLEDYLVGLQMVVDIAPANSLTLPRVAQLTNKTNQFNLTTRRYNEAQIIEMQTLGAHVYGMNVADSFGDNGLVGVAITTPTGPDSWEIDSFLMSCRVMGRGAETALLAVIIEQLRNNRVTEVHGWFLPTAKNEPVKDFYRGHGFTLVETREDGSEHWSLQLEASSITPPAWLTVRNHALQL